MINQQMTNKELVEWNVKSAVYGMYLGIFHNVDTSVARRERLARIFTEATMSRHHIGSLSDSDYEEKDKNALDEQVEYELRFIFNYDNTYDLLKHQFRNVCDVLVQRKFEELDSNYDREEMDSISYAIYLASYYSEVKSYISSYNESMTTAKDNLNKMTTEHYLDNIDSSVNTNDIEMAVNAIETSERNDIPELFATAYDRAYSYVNDIANVYTNGIERGVKNATESK